MKAIAHSAGTLIFATLVAIVCTAWRVRQTPATTFMAIGVLIGFCALVYVSRLTASASVFRFAAEAWLAGAICYLLLAFLATGLELDREGMLALMAAWASAASTSLLPRAEALAELGAGILVLCFFGEIYLARRS